MASNSADRLIMLASVRVYQALLVVYPTNFHEEYASHMVQAFQDCCLRELRQAGPPGMLKLWSVTLLDLIQSAISEHARKEVQMKTEMNPEDVRLAGQALMWGAATFVIGILIMVGGAQLWGISVIFTHLLSMPLVVAGLLGLRRRYGEKAGGLASSLLWLGAVLGPLLTFLGLFGISFGSRALQVLFIIGPAVPLAGLALFGIVALFTRPLPRWNAVPVLAGLAYPILVTSYIIYLLSTGDADGDPGVTTLEVAITIMCLIQGIALAVLGYLLKSDLPDVAAVPA